MGKYFLIFIFTVILVAVSGQFAERVVDNALEKLRKFDDNPDELDLLKNIAKVESCYGTDPTYNASRGGIWQLDGICYNDTRDIQSHPNLTSHHNRILELYGVKWMEVTYEQLNESFYSLLAARLYLLNIGGDLPKARDLEKQADYWKAHYNKNPYLDKEYFLRRVKKGIVRGACARGPQPPQPQVLPQPRPPSGLRDERTTTDSAFEWPEDMFTEETTEDPSTDPEDQTTEDPEDDNKVPNRLLEKLSTFIDNPDILDLLKNSVGILQFGREIFDLTLDNLLSELHKKITEHFRIDWMKVTPKQLKNNRFKAILSALLYILGINKKPIPKAGDHEGQAKFLETVKDTEQKSTTIEKQTGGEDKDTTKGITDTSSGDPFLVKQINLHGDKVCYFLVGEPGNFVRLFHSPKFGLTVNVGFQEHSWLDKAAVVTKGSIVQITKNAITVNNVDVYDWSERQLETTGLTIEISKERILLQYNKGVGVSAVKDGEGLNFEFDHDIDLKTDGIFGQIGQKIVKLERQHSKRHALITLNDGRKMRSALIHEQKP
ncbi:unnamed protein product, partial [Owenia fusiformis]